MTFQEKIELAAKSLKDQELSQGESLETLEQAAAFASKLMLLMMVSGIGQEYSPEIISKGFELTATALVTVRSFQKEDGIEI